MGKRNSISKTDVAAILLVATQSTSHTYYKH